MNNFLKRIKNDALLPYIDLNQYEENLYHGTGHVLIKTNNDGQIIDISYLGNYSQKSDAEKSALDFYGKGENVFFGILSCFQLCEPIGGEIAITKAILYIQREYYS